MAKVFTITEGLENMGALKTGGQGSVYKGRRIGEIITAVKLLPTPIHSESLDDKHFTDFQNEVHKLKRVSAIPNPNVVKILSSGITESGSLPFIEMEYVEGPDLEDLLQPPNDPVFTIREAIKVADQLSNALSHCHQVNVKHGDVKTNNVKFNLHTGNYILLDFGMAMLSDEQRRTSLRHAGAIEFMAPEQNEGHIFFQTDVYSFGVVLFELLAGTVPFPLKDRGETSRNTVMLSHMETEPPDLLALREQALPATWTEEKKAHEMQVPEWLINTIYICLQKKPESRFADGKALHDYITLRNTKNVSAVSESEMLQQLRSEKQEWLREKAALQQQLLHYQEQEKNLQASSSPYPNSYSGTQKKSRTYLYFLLAAALLAGIYFWSAFGKNKGVTNASVSSPAASLGEYKVLADKAYFYDEPNALTKRSSYLVPSAETLTALDDKNGFIYTDFTNSRGKHLKGWLLKTDLLPLDEWKAQQEKISKEPPPPDIPTLLATARKLMLNNHLKEAQDIYKSLAEQGVPEAMYEFGNMGLQNKTTALNCAQAYNMVTDASDRGYAPAKRTLGILYFFADNPDVLQINNYENCRYERNVFKGTKLLTEAMMGGDTTARRLVEELHLARMPQSADSLQQ